MSMDPVHQNEDGWYYWNETWSDEYGPFESRERAEEACRNYANSL